MKLEDGRQSDNVEDRRGQDDGGGGIAGGMLGSGGHLGLGAMLVLGIIGYALGIDPRVLISGAEMLQGSGQQISQSQPRSAQPSGQPPANDQMKRFVSAILAENEDVWGQVLPAQTNIRYVNPKLVLFSGQTNSECGGKAVSAMGPFYCPVDQKVYLDTSFFSEMKSKYGGGGDFAYAYVIAHEIGHHVENLLGILPKIQQLQDQATSKAQSNALSVRVELMADCLSGVWAANANQKWQILEQGDVEKAMATAQAIGDDRLQTAARGYSMPDSFTHGSSAQRQQWLMTGLKSGTVDSCLPLMR